MRLRRSDWATRAYRHAKRCRQILTILARHGFAEFVGRLGLDEILTPGQKPPQAEPDVPPDRSLAKRLRQVMELGPTFIKMGQVLSTRPDLIPLKFITELSRLQDDVPPFPADQAKAIIELELQRPLSTLYRRFDDTPLAAASLGQVHRAAFKRRSPGNLEVPPPVAVRPFSVALGNV